MSIYFVRHGQTDWNKDGYLQGQSDIELNEEGLRQAEIVKEALRDIPLDKLICSPLKRTRKTAEVISEGRHLPMIEDARLIERNFGELEGKHRSYWKDISFWELDSDAGHGIEPMEQLFDRIYRFLDEIIEEAVDRNILIVAHGGVSIPYQCYFDEANRERNLAELILKNCEIAKRESKKKIKG